MSCRSREPGERPKAGGGPGVVWGAGLGSAEWELMGSTGLASAVSERWQKPIPGVFAARLGWAQCWGSAGDLSLKALLAGRKRAHKTRSKAGFGVFVCLDGVSFPSQVHQARG